VTVGFGIHLAVVLVYVRGAVIGPGALWSAAACACGRADSALAGHKQRNHCRNFEKSSESVRLKARVSQTPGAGTMNLRTLIVDDEDLARQLLREYAQEIGGLDIVAECSNGFDAVKLIGELRPELVFLDVQMPKLDGFEVLQLVDPVPAVIFVTAYDQYAMRAFDAHAVDYLLKPFSLDRFSKAVEHARSRLGEPLPTAALLATEATPPGQRIVRIVVKDGSKVHVIPLDKLDYVEAQDDYVALHSDHRNYLKQQTISSIEAQLDPVRFVRIHRSYIVNMERIERIEPHTKDSRMAILRDGTQLPVSRSGLAKLKLLWGA